MNAPHIFPIPYPSGYNDLGRVVDTVWACAVWLSMCVFTGDM